MIKSGNSNKTANNYQSDASLVSDTSQVAEAVSQRSHGRKWCKWWTQSGSLTPRLSNWQEYFILDTLINKMGSPQITMDPHLPVLKSNRERCEMEKTLCSFSLWRPELLDPLGFFFLMGNWSSYPEASWFWNVAIYFQLFSKNPTGLKGTRLHSFSRQALSLHSFVVSLMPTVFLGHSRCK